MSNKILEGEDAIKVIKVIHKCFLVASIKEEIRGNRYVEIKESYELIESLTIKETKDE